MQRLSKKHDLYPKCFALEGGMVTENDPIAVGRFADVYKGTLKDQTVCLKMIKVLNLEDIAKVCFLDGVNCHVNLKACRHGTLSNLHTKPFFGDSYHIPISFHFMVFIGYVLEFALSHLGFQMAT